MTIGGLFDDKNKAARARPASPVKATKVVAAGPVKTITKSVAPGPKSPTNKDGNSKSDQASKESRHITAAKSDNQSSEENLQDGMISSRFCTECGHAHAAEDKFCANCGHKRK